MLTNTNMYSAFHLRSLLFVPGDDVRKLRSAEDCHADAVLADFEDSVLPNQKAAARRKCAEFSVKRSPSRPLLVRINSARSPWFRADVDALRDIRSDGIVLPKCESQVEIQTVLEAIDGDVPIYPLIETPLGLLRAEEIANASKMVAALTFGAEDFCCAMEIRRSPDEIEIMPARASIVTVAKAYGLAAIDSPSLALEDSDQIRRDASRSFALGFTGKFAIHPLQLDVINEVFTPTAKEVAEASLLLAEASAHDKGAFRWSGQMVDEAMLRRARRVLEQHKHRTDSGGKGSRREILPS